MLATQSRDPILTIENLRAGYGNNTVLSGLHLQAEPGRITGVLGPNGAGKSTLLKAIFGFLENASGSIKFEGREILGLKPHQVISLGISYVLQGRGLFPYMSVQENLEMGAYVRKDQKEVKAEIEELCRRYPVLRAKKGLRAGLLSGGEQRIVELARAQLLAPKLMLVDEPSLGLAPKLAGQVYEEILKIKAGGVGIVLVEQNVRQALAIADYGYILDLGENRFEGQVEALKHEPGLAQLYLGGSV